jgi:Ca2+-binding RTX toxin-like protein
VPRAALVRTFFALDSSFISTRAGGDDPCPEQLEASMPTVTLSRRSDQYTTSSSRDYTVFGLEGNDTIKTGSGDDSLFGGEGKDYLNSGKGDDLLEGGAGGDQLNGGLGNDTATYATSDAGVFVDLAAGTGKGGHAEGDKLSNIENLTGSDFKDYLWGDSKDNVLSGLGGNDALFGGDGDDTLIGGEGGDWMVGGSGVDTASYEGSSAGVDVNLDTGRGYGGDAQGDYIQQVENLTGSSHDDSLTGNKFNNVLEGKAGDDLLFGLDGNDDLRGGAGDDVLEGGRDGDKIDGGSGTDIASYASSSSGVVVNLMNGTASGGDAQGDQLTSIEGVIGSAFADHLTGSNRDDIIKGGAGDDVIRGGDGIDEIWGGAGNDRFVFDENDDNGSIIGWNIEGIGDFVAGGTEDVIDLTNSGSGFSSLQDVLSNSQVMTGAGGQFGTLIDLGPSGGVLLMGVMPTDLTTADFIF